jgi:hypothetical protein
MANSEYYREPYEDLDKEKMYLLIQELYLDEHCKPSGDILIEKLLGDMYVY